MKFSFQINVVCLCWTELILDVSCVWISFRTRAEIFTILELDGFILCSCWLDPLTFLIVTEFKCNLGLCGRSGRPVRLDRRFFLSDTFRAAVDYRSCWWTSSEPPLFRRRQRERCSPETKWNNIKPWKSSAFLLAAVQIYWWFVLQEKHLKSVQFLSSLRNLIILILSIIKWFSSSVAPGEEEIKTIFLLFWCFWSKVFEAETLWAANPTAPFVLLNPDWLKPQTADMSSGFLCGCWCTLKDI